VQIEFLRAEVLHTRWRREFWDANWGHLCAVGFSVFGCCAAFGCVFVASTGCRANCDECAAIGDCNFRDMCAWNADSETCYEKPVCDFNCRDCKDEASCDVAVRGGCRWYEAEGGVCEYAFCDSYCEYCLSPDACGNSTVVGGCGWDAGGGGCTFAAKAALDETEQVCTAEHCVSFMNDCVAGMREQRLCDGGLEAVVVDDGGYFWCVDWEEGISYGEGACNYEQ
jgi:hypothetical protein